MDLRFNARGLIKQPATEGKQERIENQTSELNRGTSQSTPPAQLRFSPLVSSQSSRYLQARNSTPARQNIGRPTSPYSSHIVNQHSHTSIQQQINSRDHNPQRTSPSPIPCAFSSQNGEKA